MEKNLLLREVFRLFETTVKLDYSDGRVESEKVEEFLDQCFQDKLPLYLVLVLTEEEGLMDSLFDKKSEFLASLTSGMINEHDKQYLNRFISFLDPFNAEASIKPLLEYLLKSDKGTFEFDFPILPCLLPIQQENHQPLLPILVAAV